MITLIVLVVLIIGIYLIKRFLDNTGKYYPSRLVMMFLKKVKDIEDNENGRIVVKRYGDYEVIVLVEGGKIIEAISVDMVGNKIYSGVVKDNKPSWGDILIPIKLPFGVNTKGIEELRELEDKLVDEVIEVIVKYKK